MANGALSSLVRELLEQEERWHNDPSTIWGLSTSFPSWDLRTGGLHNGEVTLLAARTSQGKTALGNQVAFAAVERLIDEALEVGEYTGQVVIFSPEMTRGRLLMRYASSASEVPAKKIRTGTATEEERERWRSCLEMASLFDPVLTIRAGRSIDAVDLGIDVEALHHQRPIKLLIIDYLQRISGKGASAYEQATYVSREVKNIANGMNIPVLAMSQVRRSDNRNNQNPPTMYELRDSGSLEQDADNVIILHVPEALDHEAVSDRAKAFLNIEKQRDGETGEFALWFNRDIAKFEDSVSMIQKPGF